MLGLVDELLGVSRNHGLHLDWNADHCRVWFKEGDPPTSIEVPLRKSVVRAALAHVAVLCNQRNPNSVSPYGGKGELLVGSEPATPVRVAFVNTPDEQSLELTPLRNDHAAAVSGTPFEGQIANSAPASGAGT